MVSKDKYEDDVPKHRRIKELYVDMHDAVLKCSCGNWYYESEGCDCGEEVYPLDYKHRK